MKLNLNVPSVNRKDYSLILSIESGDNKGKLLQIKFLAQTNEQALELTKHIIQLETMNNKPITFGNYILRKKKCFFFWETIKSNCKNS